MSTASAKPSLSRRVVASCSRQSVTVRVAPLQAMSKATSANSEPRPEVIVEFLFDDGSLFVSIRNIGEKPALGIAVHFDKKFYGAAGTKEISALALFKNIEFLGPQREIVAFIDQSCSYFGGRQPTTIQAKISYHDTQRNKYEESINHNLEIYRELPYRPRSAQGCKQ